MQISGIGPGYFATPMNQVDAAWLAANAGEVEGVVTAGHLGLPAALMSGAAELKIIAFHPDAASLARESDVFVVCAAVADSTRRLIGRAVFDAIGPMGCLVNVARGSIVDEPALVVALQDKRIGGAALDVFEDEPNVPAALLEVENVVVTPHIASATHDTRRMMGAIVLASLDA